VSPCSRCGLSFPVTSITSVPLDGTVVPCSYRRLVAIVPIRVGEVPPLKVNETAGVGGVMKMMHLCYAAIGFAVARWIFRRQAVPVVDPVTRFRSQGLL